MRREEWSEAFRLLHTLWGRSRMSADKGAPYDKATWMRLLELLERARAEAAMCSTPEDGEN